MAYPSKRCAVIALGGNAISPPDWEATIADQFRHTRESLRSIVELLRKDYLFALTHGNGPQVGDALRRVELTKNELPEKPLGVLVADTQGSMGYMIEQSLQNLLAREGIDRRVVTVITQVLVDDEDPALSNPTKFVGQIYTRAEAERFMRDHNWKMKPFDGDDRWRRVVGSPEPLEIINGEVINDLVRSGVIVIAAGGGGIPVYKHPFLGLEGCDAVIDKDLAGAILAKSIGADELIILTNIDAVYLDFGKPTKRSVERMTVDEASRYLEAGQFPSGSMGPKIRAAVNFLRAGGERTLICALDQFDRAIHGKAGTWIIP